MSLPRPTSIRHRLLALSAAISVLTLTMAGSLFVINDVAMLRHQMVRDLEVLSVVIGDNCLSALAFDAPETAEKNLSSLRREYQIRYAALYDAAGRPFARYSREGESRQPVPTPAEDGVFVDVSLIGLGSIEVVRTLTLDERPIGRLFIHARTDELAAQLRRYAGIVVLLLAATLSASLLLAWRLQRRVSQPILELAAMTQQVSERSDYRLRVTPPAADDELATLYRGFNAMLEQIEHRDRELTEMGARLEHLVEARTRDLDTVVREQRLIVEALPLGIIHLVGRRIARVNTRAAELFGLSPEDMIGRSTEEFYPDRAAFEEVGRKGYAQMASGSIYRDDRILKRRDGSRFWGRLIGQYIDPSNERLGSIWIVDDIGRDKALEERLRQAREAAEGSSRAKDTFMANMSHELRTPLNSVLGFAQLLDADPGLSNAQREQVQSIRRGGERLLGLINEVLDLAKIEADRLELTPVDWDSAALLQELEAMFRPRTEQKGIALRIDPAPELPPRLRCDARRLHQVLVNLLDNAVKFTNQGEVALRAGFADDVLLIEVQDTGIGIAASDIDAIFEPFRQVGESRQHPGGTGLGLAICKRLVTHMGGSLGIESTPGRGTTFKVLIPVQRAPDIATGSTGLGAKDVIGYRRRAGTGPIGILVADDEPENRALLRGVLEPIGFDVHEVSTGTDCVAQALRLAPDLILMDLRMPIMDGLAATRRLRQHPQTRGTPIVAVTAAAFEDDRARALDAGCTAHLSKPVIRETLLATLGALLPLEWTRRDGASREEPALELDALSAGQRAQLIGLVRSGSVTSVAAMAQELAADGCCPALARQLSGLAEAFDIAGLRRLVVALETVQRPREAEPPAATGRNDTASV